MRRILRNLFRILASISLLLALATGFLWANGALNWFRFHFPPINHPSRLLYIGAGPNMLIFDDHHLDAHPIVGPSRTDTAAVAEFQKRFGKAGWFDISAVRIKTLTRPDFGTTSD